MEVAREHRSSDKIDDTRPGLEARRKDGAK
jgi:hypothetical protein